MKQKRFWPDNSAYFLTGSTFLHYPYFRDYDQKQILLEQIKKLQQNMGIDVSAYSIAINHYHLKFYLKDGLMLSKVRQLMHGGTTYEYKKRHKMNHKQMWQGSKVVRVTTEEMDWKVTGYIIGNLLKHKEVGTFEELNDCPFSSYRYTADKYGEGFARHLVYSVIDVPENAEGMVGIGELQSKKLKLKKPSAQAG
jgi:REP element-mobilizing transposase RayT